MKANQEAYIRQAIDAGCPPDQLKLFRRVDYAALPWALTLHAAARAADRDGGPFWIGAGGARGPGKSHAFMEQAGADDCQRFPGLRFLFLRKVQKAAKESFEDLTRRTLRGLDADYRNGLVRFANGSSILVGGYNNESDIDGYLGNQYDGAVIEEMTQLSKDKVTKVRGSIRSSIPGWRPRVYNSTNPGGVGHKFYREEFVKPHQKDITDHQFVGGRTLFIPATYRDNPFLDVEYVSYLENLPGPLGQAWRDGNWDAFEGMAFPDFNRSVHMCKPFDIPSWWPRWRAVDWGFAAPFSVGWFTKDPDIGRIYIYRARRWTKLTDRQQARTIIEYTPKSEDIKETLADPSMWASKNQEDIVSSTADEYEVEGVKLTKGDNNRISGKRKMHRVLANLPDGKPGLQIFDGEAECVADCLENLPADPNNPEDVDTRADDHDYDMTRYGLTHYEDVRGIDPEKQKQKQVQKKQVAHAREVFGW